MNQQEVLVYTSDRKVALYKIGTKNRTVDLHDLVDPMSLTSKRASSVVSYDADLAAADLATLFADIDPAILTMRNA